MGIGIVQHEKCLQKGEYWSPGDRLHKQFVGEERGTEEEVPSK